MGAAVRRVPRGAERGVLPRGRGVPVRVVRRAGARGQPRGVPPRARAGVRGLRARPGRARVPRRRRRAVRGVRRAGALANPLARRHQRVPVAPLPAITIPATSVLAEAVVATATVLGDKDEEVDSWLLLSKDSDNNNNNNNNNDNDNKDNNNSNSSNNGMYFGEVDEYFDLVGYNSYYDNRIENNQDQQYGMHEQQEQQQQQQEMQKEFAEKEGSECVVPSQITMLSEQQHSGYGVVGADQAASMTAGVSAYTDSISNSVSSSITSCNYFFFREWTSITVVS